MDLTPVETRKGVKQMAKDLHILTFHYVEIWKRWMTVIVVLSAMGLCVARFMQGTDWPFTALFIQLGLSWIFYVTRDVLKNRTMSGMDRAMIRRRNGFL